VGGAGRTGFIVVRGCRRVLAHALQPDAADAVTFAMEHCQRTAAKSMLVVVGRCRVRYNGRARSFLDWGDRLLVVKPDGTVMVHRPDGRMPVNWQPAGSRVSYALRNGRFMVSAVHYKNREQMQVLFRDVDLMMAASMEDRAELQLVGMEQDIVDKIMDSPDVIEPGLRITQREKQVPSGMIDLYGHDEHDVPVVIEVKRSQATISAVQQLRMYVRDLQHGNPDANVRGILCTPRIPEMIRRLLDDYDLEWREFGWQHELDLERQHSLDDYL